MKKLHSNSPSICSFIILLFCVPYVVSSHRGLSSTTIPPKPLKFYMQPWHPQFINSADVSNDIIAGATPNENSVLMLVNISFRNPPVPQLLIMDTGGNLIWVQCASCTKCFKQRTPLYDPSKSNTYEDLDCNSSFCQVPLECDYSSDICTYNTSYVDKTGTKGKMGTDQLTFKSNKGIVTKSDVVFGCGIENTINPHSDLGSGILGLRPGSLSLTTQKGHQFSYCIGNLNNHTYPYNILIIGEGAIFQGKTTPLEVYGERYYLTMEGISVGDKLLDIDPKTFHRSPSGVGGMRLDSGSTFSIFPRVAYEALKAEVISVIGSSLNISSTSERFLCYWGFLNQTAGFPTVKFHFAGGTDLDLQPNSFFKQRNWYTICMAVAMAREAGQGYIGLLSQQNYNVGYDVDGKKLYIDNVDCESLDD